MPGYVKKVRESLKESGTDEAEIKAFEGGMNKLFVEMMGDAKTGPKFGDWDLYRGESDFEGKGM